MRRRVKEDTGIGGRAALMDARTWERCDRFDGGDQPCLCWFSERQLQLEDDGLWPGGEVVAFEDWLTATQEHECKRPFDWSAI